MNIIDIKNSKIDEIIELRTILEKDPEIEQLETILKKLDGFNITYDDLKVTKIGHSLKKLTKHKSETITKKAESLMNKWKKLVGSNSTKETKEMSSPQKSKNMLTKLQG
jgi:hypothetical protein